VHRGVHRLALAAAIVAFFVIVLGAYVRLSHAGLGCPDWPGCYGKLTWPAGAAEIEQASAAFPERPVETGKAWREMVHRYLAGILVMLVAAINLVAWRSRPVPQGVRSLAAALLVLILFQAALGMWTVTLKLKPIVVMAHLMGGLATFSLLLWLSWKTGERRPPPAAASRFAALRPLILAGLLILIGQLALGGWTSANYAALACPDFPTCQGQWWPATNFDEGFVLWREIGVDYEGGVLDLPARTAIHLTHRLGALVVLLVIGILAWLLLARSATRRAGAGLLALLLAQISLGVLNIVLYLPLPNAVAHNATGALLLGAMIWLLNRSQRPAA
jgi:cytochrome c oxidase assembly protein subunit 15